MAAGDAPVRLGGWRKVFGYIWRGLSFVLAAWLLYLFVTEWGSWQGSARWQTTDDAYLQADLTPLAAQVSGYVRAVPAQDYASVKAGQLVVLLDDDSYRTALIQAEAEVAAARAQIGQVQAQKPLLQANLAAADAAAAAMAAQLAQNGRDLDRAERLLRSGSASTEDVEKTRTAHAELTAQFNQARAQAEAVQRQIDLLVPGLAAARAALEAKQGALLQAQLNLSYTRIVAPEDGVIGLRQVFPGQFVAAGTQVTTLAGLPHVWVLANYKETQLTRVRVGQSAVIRIDTFPNARLRGHVVAISPASGALLALLPPDNATGNFTKIVQRIAVKISVDDAGGLAGLLRPGMSVVPSIDTHSGPRG